MRMARLVGRFRWEGVLDTRPLGGQADGRDLLRVQGMGDCVAVGQGPGVQCVLDVRWVEDWTPRGEPIAVPNLNPAMSLYGLDAIQERFARFNAPIVRASAEPAAWMDCLWTTRITARPDKDVIHINIDYGDRWEPSNQFTRTLRRIRKPTE